MKKRWLYAVSSIDVQNSFGGSLKLDTSKVLWNKSTWIGAKLHIFKLQVFDWTFSANP